MFENLNNLTLKGGCFGEGTTLNGILRDRINIVYGPNGSGKSTISKSLAKFASGVPFSPETNEPQCLFTPTEISDLTGNTYVFNEEFVDNKVKVCENGLESIVMFGDDIAIDSKQNELEQNIDKLNSDIERYKSEIYGDGTGNNPGYLSQIEALSKKVEKNLKKDGCYADRGKEINNAQRKITVKLDDFEKLSSKSSSISISSTNLYQQINDGISALKGLRTAERIYWTYDLSSLANIINVNELLQKTIPMLQLKDEFIAKLAKTSRDTIVTAQHSIVEEGLERCPYCQQPISKEWMEILKDNIKAVLNEEADDFSKQLCFQIAQISEIQLLYPNSPNGKFDKSILSVAKSLHSYNVFIQNKIIKSLEEKKNNMYSSSPAIDVDEYNNLVEGLTKSIQELKREVDLHNSSIETRDKTQNELLQKNLLLGYLENQSDIDTIVSLKKQVSDANTELNRLSNRKDEFTYELMQINQRKQNTSTAMDIINSFITCVFADSKRLKLIATDDTGKYKLLCREQNVSPKDVSTGERNILALAYFFTTLLQDTHSSNRYSKPMFIIIDDPVSSFDAENRAGIWTFIKSILTKILNENYPHSKLLVMSHDRQVITNMRGLKNYYYEAEENNFALQLVNQDCVVSLKPYADRGGTYINLLNQLYDFMISNNPDDLSYSGMGNIMRQVVEIFSKFYNNSDCKEILEDDSVWYQFNVRRLKKLVPNHMDFYKCQDKMKEGIRNYLSRDVANILSHSPNNIDAITDEEYIKPKELQKQIKYLFVFMDCIAENHTKGFLRKERDKEKRAAKNKVLNANIEELFFNFNPEIKNSKVNNAAV